MTLDYHNPMHGPTQRRKVWRTVIAWCGGLIVALFLLSLLFMPALGRAREEANRIKCASNLRQIGQAAFLYANDHGGQLPPDFPTLFQTADLYPEVFACPSSDAEKATGPTTQQVAASLLSGNHLSYAWTGAGLTTAAPADVILAFDLERHVPKDSEKTTGINVLIIDGSVTFVNEATAKAIWAQFAAGVRPIRLSTCTTARHHIARVLTVTAELAVPHSGQRVGVARSVRLEYS
jgi:hypothetical protein